MAKNGTTQAATASMAANEDKQWEDLKTQFRKTTSLFGGLIFTPFIFFLGITYGIRAGIVVSLKKTLELLNAWDR